MANNSKQDILDVLLADKVISAERLAELKKIAQARGSNIEEVLIKEKVIDAEKLAASKAKIWGIGYINLADKSILKDVLNVISFPVAQNYQVICFNKAANQIDVGILDYGNLKAIEAVNFLAAESGYQAKYYVISPESFNKAFNLYQTIAEEVEVALKARAEEAEEKREAAGMDKEEKTEGVIKAAPISKIVSVIIRHAIEGGASDIHVEPEEKATRVRYRIDGILHEKFTMPKSFHDSLVSRIKILSGMKIDEKRIPQDGRFNFKSGVEEVDLRVSSLPTVHGEKIVMRLLKKSGGVPKLPELGLRGRALKNLEDAILRPHGIIIICGPTGSGKTTTLYSVLSKINTPKVNIVTLEDPVEYQIPGVNQVQVNPGAGLTFASGLRSFLRQDPNVIMVGEIRDAETAALAVQASLTGHLVFSTLHTNDASGVLPRLLDMGIEPFLLGSTMTCIVAQRVVRRIHEDCKVEYPAEAGLVGEMKDLWGNLFPTNFSGKIYKGRGDAECGGTGYMGRVGVFEVMPVSEKIAKMVVERASGADIEKVAKEEGMITMKQDGYLKVVEGATTVEEILRVAQE